jgi:hypothetical protein
MSKVWLARHRDSDTDVAVKIVPIDDLSPELERRLRREPEIHHSLHHDNIVALHDWFREGDEFFLVLEYVRGRPLSAIIKEDGPIPFERAREIMRGVLHAVAHLHRNGIVHRDIKPANILIDERGRPRLTDFGIAKFTWQQGETRTQKGLGTPEYMSPEQIRGIGIDEQSDIWGLGITFFEMLTGRKPFSRREETPAHFAEVVSRILNDPLPDPRTFWPSIPDGAVDLIHRATAQDPQHRFKTCAEVLGALELIDPTRITPVQDTDATVVLGVGDRPGGASGVPASSEERPVAGVAPMQTGQGAGGASGNGAVSRGTDGVSDRPGRGPLIVIMIILIVAVAGYVGYSIYDANRQKESTEPLTSERALELSRDLASDYKNFSFDGNVAALTTLYATQDVSFFRLRNVGRNAIEQEYRSYFDRIVRTDQLDVEVNRVSVVNDSTFTTEWIITYLRLKDDGTQLQGQAIHEFTVSRFGATWLIVKERQKAVRRQDVIPPPVDTTEADSTTADTTEQVVDEEPIYPSRDRLEQSIEAMILLLNSGKGDEAWAQYAGDALRGRGGFPDVLKEGSISLRSTSFSDGSATAIVVKSDGFTQKEMTIRFQFEQGDDVKLKGIDVSQ